MYIHFVDMIADLVINIIESTIIIIVIIICTNSDYEYSYYYH